MNLKRLFIFIICCCLAGKVGAQSFQKKQVFLETGIKLAFYSIKNTNDVQNEDEGDNGDFAASYTIPLVMEYAITNRIGAGLELGYGTYFTDRDSVTRAIATAGCFDALLNGSFHWVRSERVDLSSGIGFGISAFHYESNDYYNSKYKSTGAYFRLNLIRFRVFISDQIGLQAGIGIPHMNFSNGRITDKLGSDFEYPLSFTGFDLCTGIVIRF